MTTHRTTMSSPYSALVDRASRCQCGQPIFFLNSSCLACGSALGYYPERSQLVSLSPGPEPDTWREWSAAEDEGGDGAPEAADSAPIYRRCANLSSAAACNWLVTAEADANDDPAPYCRSCRMNRTIPALNDPAFPDNAELWGRVELAKRRLVSALIALRLPVASRVSEDTERGLMFDFLRGPQGKDSIMTGHEDGLITLNLEEADDATREAARKAMGEPYRTLLGHLRHEVGHYYWDRIVDGTQWLEGYRGLFGDETQDYPAALERHYQQGPPADWPQHFVSAYATSHPWEDWAECWAHYLHMRDTVDTALSFGLDIESPEVDITAFGDDALWRAEDPDAGRFLLFVNGWTRLTTMLNEMSRSMGQPDFYPFVLSREVVAKLQFIHMVVSDAGSRAEAAMSPDRLGVSDTAG